MNEAMLAELERLIGVMRAKEGASPQEMPLDPMMTDAPTPSESLKIIIMGSDKDKMKKGMM